MSNKKVARSELGAPGEALSYDEIAARMQGALDTIASLIPSVPMIMGNTVSYIRQRLGVSPTVIARTATAAEESALLRSLMDVADARDMLDMEKALRPVFQRMNMVNEDLRLALDARRAKCGAEAMNVYAAAKRLAARPGAPEIAPHLDQIKDVMPKGKGPRKKKQTMAPPAASGESQS
jgi:hypothetical protein